MSTSLPTLIRLRAIQNKTRQLFENLNDIHYRLQFHKDLNPAGWLLVRGIFIENYWLHKVIQSDDQYTSEQSIFFSHNGSKAQLGPGLPKLHELLNAIEKQQDFNDILLLQKTPPLSQHPLFKDEYIENIIIQHYAQCYENLLWIFSHIALHKDKGQYRPNTPLKSHAILENLAQVTSGKYSVGGSYSASYDNECPVHDIQLNDFLISHTPVTNAEYLHFIEADAYKDRQLWSNEAWHWLQKNSIQQPQYWKQNKAGDWYGVNHQGAHDLLAKDCVAGISHYEATAFAKWAGAKLPHEHQWEIAANLEAIKKTTRVWEWSHSPLCPYPGFQPLPAKKPEDHGFDGQHYVLKGAGIYTRPEIKRSSFRLFKKPYCRHMFAGVRLLYS